MYIFSSQWNTSPQIPYMNHKLQGPRYYGESHALHLLPLLTFYTVNEVNKAHYILHHEEWIQTSVGYENVSLQTMIPKSPWEPKVKQRKETQCNHSHLDKPPPLNLVSPMDVLAGHNRHTLLSFLKQGQCAKMIDKNTCQRRVCTFTKLFHCNQGFFF